MFTRIVVGVDGSPDAREAVRIAGQLASTVPEATVAVVTAYEPLAPSELQRLDRELPDEYRDQLTGDLLIRPHLEEAASMLAVEGVAHTTHERRAKPADAIVAVADDIDADLIVVGSRGEGAFDRLRHGSTSTRVLHEAKRSVLVVQPHPH